MHNDEPVCFDFPFVNRQTHVRVIYYCANKLGISKIEKWQLDVVQVQVMLLNPLRGFGFGLFLIVLLLSNSRYF